VTQILETNSNFVPQEKVERFEFIDNNLNLTNHEKVAVFSGFSVNSGKNTLRELFNTFWEMSNNLGANSFTVDTVERVADIISVQISVYYLDSTTLEDNFSLYPKNMIYVFGNLDAKNGSTRRIRLDRQRVELAPLEYVEFQNEIGKYTRVSIGGFAGTRVDIFGREGRLPMYLSFGGLKVGPSLGPTFNPNPSVGISISTGNIHPIQMNIGQFLISILTKKELYSTASN
jgi:hypothetical protein